MSSVMRGGRGGGGGSRGGGLRGGRRRMLGRRRRSIGSRRVRGESPQPGTSMRRAEVSDFVKIRSNVSSMSSCPASAYGKPDSSTFCQIQRNGSRSKRVANRIPSAAEPSAASHGCERGRPCRRERARRDSERERELENTVLRHRNEFERRCVRRMPANVPSGRR